MDISEWVHTCHNMNKITGFITEINNEQATIFVTIPKNYGEINVKLKDLIPGSTIIWLDDIPTLIDLSLVTQDKDWFIKWTNELRLWKPINTI